MNILKKLKTKFILINLLCVMSIITIVSGVFLYINIKNYKDTAGNFMNMELYRYIFGFDDNGKYANMRQPVPKDVENIPDRDYRNMDSILVTVDSENTIINSFSFNNALDTDDISSYIDFIIKSKKDDGYTKDVSFRYKKQSLNNYTYIVFKDMSSEKEYIFELIFLFTIIYLLNLIIFFFLSNFLATISLAPVKRAWEEQTRFVSDASHELRTPISIVIANLNILEKKLQPATDDKKWLLNSQAEMLNMQKLIENLLFLARSDNQNKSLPLERLNLSTLINERTLNLEVLAFEKNIAFTTDIIPDLYINSNAELLIQLFTILTDNALKYSPTSGHIFVALANKNGKTVLSVRNLGSYIEKENIAHIFDRFYRIDKSRNSDIKGYGLGLSIASEICKKINAEISVYSGKEYGTEFKISFKAL